MVVGPFYLKSVLVLISFGKAHNLTQWLQSFLVPYLGALTPCREYFPAGRDSSEKKSLQMALWKNKGHAMSTEFIIRSSARRDLKAKWAPRWAMVKGIIIIPTERGSLPDSFFELTFSSYTNLRLSFKPTPVHLYQERCHGAWGGAAWTREVRLWPSAMQLLRRAPAPLLASRC